MNYNENFSFVACYQTGKEYYFSNNLFNGLIRYNKENETFEYLGLFMPEKTTRQGLHHGVYRNKDDLFFVPDASRGIHRYNLTTKEMTYFPLDVDKHEKYRGIDSYKINNVIWIVGAYESNPLISFDMDTCEIKKYDIFLKAMPEELKHRKGAMFWSMLAKRETDMYSTVWDSNYIVHIDLSVPRAEFICLQDAVEALGCIGLQRDTLFMAEQKKDAVTSYNLVSKEIKKYELAPDVELEIQNGVVYTNIIAADGHILLVPHAGKKLLEINEQTCTIDNYGSLPEGFTDGQTFGRKTWRRFVRYEQVEGKIYLYPNGASEMLVVDLQSGQIKGEAFKMNKEWYERYFQKLIAEPYITECMAHGLIKETELVGLEEFSKFLES